MAAVDLFQKFFSSLSDRDRAGLSDYVKACREDLEAARSEEARIRIAENFVRGAHDLLRSSRRP